MCNVSKELLGNNFDTYVQFGYPKLFIDVKKKKKKLKKELYKRRVSAIVTRRFVLNLAFLPFKKQASKQV